MIKLIKKKNNILVILIVALVPRLININQSLWLDEAIGAIAVRDFSYRGILTDFIRADNHSPFYYLTLKAWTGILGYSEIAIRFPSVIFGILTIFIAYKIARLIGNDKKSNFSVVASILLATSQFHIYYSQEARMYSMAAFLVTVAFYFFLKVFKDKKLEPLSWVLFSISITALVFTDYVPVFLLPVFWILAILYKKDANFWKAFVFAHLPLLLLGILWLPTFWFQAERGGWLLQTWPAWKNVAGGANFKQALLVWMKFVFGRISLSNKYLYYSLAVLASAPVIVSLVNSWKNRNENLIAIWLWFVVPLVLGFLVSFNFPAFIYFRFVYIVPAFYLLIAWGIEKIRNIQMRKILIFTILSANIMSWLIYIFDVNQQREQWREATKFVESKAGANEIAIFEFPEPFAPYRWYSKDSIEAKGVTNSISADPEETEKITTKAIESRSGVYYFEYLRELSDPQDVVRTTLTKSGFKVSKIYNYPGVGFIYYWIK